jgi:REP element-mobilizing transposase RayT
MTLFKNKYRIESTRLRGWDYRNPGYYFVTICTKNREPYFGQIVQGKEMHLSSMGEIAAQCWREIPKHHANVDLDEFMIMPNHTHGIIIICNPVVAAETLHATSLLPPPGESKMSEISPKAGSLGAIIRSYKSAVTRLCGLQGFSEFAWQTRYHDHIIRNENSLFRIRQYIGNNPAKWELDKENPSEF